jgi:hypothetical protein
LTILEFGIQAVLEHRKQGPLVHMIHTAIAAYVVRTDAIPELTTELRALGLRVGDEKRFVTPETVTFLCDAEKVRSHCRSVHTSCLTQATPCFLVY